MNPRLRLFWVALAGAALAVVSGWWIANGSYALPLVFAAIAAGACLFSLTRLPVDTVVLGVLLVGYIVGNRGFAQFLLIPGFPLLPGEAGIALCGGWLCFSSAFTRRLPFRRDMLNFAILLWLVLASVRIIPDVRAYGAMALRDFATIYYALFFFIAQAQMEDERKRRFLGRCLLVATIATIPLFELFNRFPDFFVGTLAIRGVPLIFPKGDLIATFMAVGVVLTHRRWEVSRRWTWLLIALLGIAGVLLSESRASLLGLVVATGWLMLRGHWALLRTQMAAVFVALFVVLGALVFGAMTSRQNFVTRMVERVATITDVSGQRSYVTGEMESKSDNNQFRLVWWQAVIEETVDIDPWFGLGFGYDLAAAFVRRYYPDSNDDFASRSPHSILITMFGRTGAVGTIAFLFVLLALAMRTVRTLRARHLGDESGVYWLAAWIILVSACFGVVLEGPMGAVVFWTILGMASGSSNAADASALAAESEESPGLPPPAEPAEVGAST